MIKNVQLNEEQLKHVNGGDDIEDAVKETIKEQEEARLNELIDEVEKNRAQRESGDLNDAFDTMLDILKKKF